MKQIYFLILMMVTLGFCVTIARAYTIVSEDHCNLLDCYSIISIVNYTTPELNALKNSAISDMNVKRGHIDFTNIQILNSSSIKVSGNIIAGTDNFWGIGTIWNSTWWNSSWNNKKAINVSTNGTLTNYQIRVWINWATNISDFSDIRFVNASENQLLAFSREGYNASANATFWVKGNWSVNNGTQAYVYYNNNTPGIASVGNGQATFDFYDNFKEDNGILNTTLWNNITGTAPIVIMNSSGLVMEGGANQKAIRGKAVFSNPIIFEFFGKLEKSVSGSATAGGLGIFDIKGVGSVDDSPAFLNGWLGGGSPAAEYLWGTGGNWAVFSSAITGNHLWTMYWNASGKATGLVDNALYAINNDTGSESHNVSIFNNWNNLGTSTQLGAIQWLRVRQFTAIEPLIVVGSEETNTLVPTLHLALNGSESNSSYNCSHPINTTVWFTTNKGTAFNEYAELWTNNVLIQNTTTPFSLNGNSSVNTTLNITAVYRGNATFSQQIISYFVNVTNCTTPTPTVVNGSETVFCNGTYLKTENHYNEYQNVFVNFSVNCTYGCDSKLNICKPSPTYTFLIVMGILLALLIIATFIKRYWA